MAAVLVPGWHPHWTVQCAGETHSGPLGGETLVQSFHCTDEEIGAWDAKRLPFPLLRRVFPGECHGLQGECKTTEKNQWFTLRSQV